MPNIQEGDIALVSGCKGQTTAWIPFIVTKYVIEHKNEYFAGWSNIEIYRRSKSGRTYKLIYKRTRA